MKQTKTLVINLYAGPGSGKSTTCAAVFSKLKLLGVNCEMALEYAKDKVWEENFKVLENQIYVFGKQLNRIFRLDGKVDVIITDSPLPLSILYDKNKNEVFKALVLQEYDKFNNINYFIHRGETYNPKGRMQNLEESKKLDKDILNMLGEHQIPHMFVVKGNDQEIVDYIIGLLEKQ